MGAKKAALGAAAVGLGVFMSWSPAAGARAAASTGLSAEALSLANGQQTLDLTQYVNPFVGTTSGGDTFPGATYPFGMVQWSPDNSTTPGGYNYGSSTITGFSLTHVSGAGCSIFGDVPFIPYSGSVSQSPVGNPSAYAMSFSHANESASAGYYSVKLDSGIGVQLTAARRSGYGEFSFPSGAPANLLINAGGSANGDSAASVRIAGNDTVVGSASSGHFCGAGNTYTVYFAAQFNQPFTAQGTWNGSSLTAGAASSSGSQSGAYVSFPSGSTVDVKVGVSYVSEQGALANLRAEEPGWGFAAAKAHAQAAWNKDLNLIQVTGGTTPQLQTFYTALYHAFLSPTTFSDVTGQYIGFDNQIHNAGSQTQYANFSGWDIYRSEMQLLSWLMPSRASNMVQSLVRDGKQGGRLPKWPVANGYSGVMDGDSADPIIAEAYALGARHFDTAQALKLMITGATVPGALPNGYNERPGLRGYLANGYVSASSQGGSSAVTLEYALDDFSIARFARMLNQPASVVDPFLKRSQNWQNAFNPVSGFIQPKSATGAFLSPFTPSSSQNFVEGSAYQYRWLVPQDFAGLFAALGGRRAAVADLNAFFAQSNAGPNSQYAWMGNEPSLTAPWAYDFAGDPAQTQQVVRQVVNQLYQPTPGGLDGNDDLGTMSAWYVWAALGMYPEIPGVAGFALGSPLFPLAVVHWGGGSHSLVIQGQGAGANAPYVQSLSVNGQAYAGSWLPLASLASSSQSVMTYGLTSSLSGSQPTVGGGVTPLAMSGAGLRRTIAAPRRASVYAVPVEPPSFTYGLAPALGFSTQYNVLATPGASTNLSVGLQGLSGSGQTFHWALQMPSLLQASSQSGSLVVSQGQRRTSPLTLNVPKNAPPGVYPVKLTFAGSTSTATPPVAVDVVVRGTNTLFADYNSVGISSDGNAGIASFDGGQRSYSAQQLQKAGLVAGSSFTAGGAHFEWPMFAGGAPDNVVASGQTLALSGTGSDLVFVGAAANGPTQGQGTIEYTDGSTQTFQLGFSDWTLGGGGESVSFGNQVVATTAYRNVVGSPSGRETVKTYLFSATVPLAPGKTVQSVTLPNPQNQGQMHIFLAGFAP